MQDGADPGVVDTDGTGMTAAMCGSSVADMMAVADMAHVVATAVACMTHVMARAGTVIAASGMAGTGDVGVAADGTMSAAAHCAAGTVAGAASRMMASVTDYAAGRT